MYEVKVAPGVNQELIDFSVRCAQDNGMDCAERMINSFEKAVSLLAEFPQRGSRRLKYIPAAYRTVSFWAHKWLVYRIDEEKQCVYVNYLIDERSNYGALLR